MKATITVKQEVEVKTLQVSAEVRYWEDATVNGQEDSEGNLIPCRNGDNWEPIIDIDSGRIVNWTQGTTADIHYKVCDAGVYKLLGPTGNVIAEREGYVPDIMHPEGGGYGDYIIMKVNADGFIENWEPNLDDIIDEEN